MTSSPATPTAVGPTAADACDACPHSLSSHDAISLRFCQATIHMAKTRACVCPA